MNLLHCFYLTLLLASPPLSAQETQITDNSDHTEKKDRSTQEFINGRGAEAALVNGGAFYVSNPPPVSKIDVDKAYLDKEFKKMHVVFRSGDEADIFARIRTVDQKVELMREGGVFELRDNYTQSLETEDGTVYLFLLDPLNQRKGVGVYEQAYVGEGRQLLVHHTAEWKDPLPKTMFDTSEPERTLDPKRRAILVLDNKMAVEIHKMRELITHLGQDDRPRAEKLRKRNKLKNRAEDYVRLLTALDDN